MRPEAAGRSAGRRGSAPADPAEVLPPPPSPPADAEDFPLPPEKEKWLRRWLAGYADPEHCWRLGGQTDSPIRGAGEAVERRIFELPPELLHDAIRDGDPVIRLLAVRAVGARVVKMDWTLAEMAGVLDDPRREIRLAALGTVERLGEYAAEVALPRMLVTIRKGANFTREYALRALRRIRPGWEPAFETLEWCMGHAYIPTKVAAHT